MLVLGLGRSGRAAALALAGRGVRVRAADRSPDADPGRLAEAGVEVRLGEEEDALIEGVELVVKSPGVPGEAPPVAAARRAGIPVWSEIELASRLLPNPILGVTGTKGKTTTSELLGAMLGAPVAGNVGRPLSGLEVDAGGWVVAELSSFQLEDIDRFRPRVAVLLNFEPDHLDRHGTVDAYRAAKARIFENQTADDVAVVPRGLAWETGAARRVEFDGADPLPAEPLIPGAHNRANAAAAAAAARAAGASEDAIAAALQMFRGVPHRLELVAEVDGVRYVNDSIATNVFATRHALLTYDAPIHVILGGYDKGADFDELAAALPANVAGVYVVGATAGRLAEALTKAGRPFVRAGDLERAVAAAREAARPGDVVLLSPACASYDQYANFEERGEHFRRLVEGPG